MLTISRRAHLAVLVMAAACSLIAGLSAQRGSGPPAPGESAQTIPVEGTGAISGIVMDGASGRPLAGAIVSILRTGAARGLDRTNTRLTSDDRGRFIFARLPAGDYQLNAAKLGYFEIRNAQRISLADGQWLADAKPTLWKFGAISGVITDEANEPVVGGYVRVLTQVLVAGMPQLAGGPIGRTDDRGVYRIPGLPPAKYLVVVPSVQSSVPADTTEAVLNGIVPNGPAASAERPSRKDQTLSPDGRNLLFLGTFVPPPPASSGRTMMYPMTFYPAARVVRDAVTVDLKNGEERSGIDLQLRPVAAVKVSGVVEAPAEAEAPGMTLRLLSAGMDSLGNGSETATALVGTDGTFTFLNVPAGEYTLIANRSQMEYLANRLNAAVIWPSIPSPPAFGSGGSGGGIIASASAGTEYSYQTTRGALTFSARQPLTVGNRDVTGVVLSLKRAVSLSGTVVNEGDNARPAGRAGGPGAPFFAEPADGSAALGMLSGQSHPDGTFSIQGLQPGLYTIRFLGIAAGRIKSIAYDGKDYTNRPFDASTGRDISGVVVTTTDKSTKISGFVRDGQTLASHGRVILFPAESEQWTGYGFSPRRIVSLTVATNGAFTVTSLPAGQYLAIAVEDGLATAWQDSKFLAAAASLATRISLDWSDTKTLELTLQQVPGFKASGGF